MSKLIATDAILGAHETVARARKKLAETIAAKGLDHPVGFSTTAYYLPVIYSFTGRKVEKLRDLQNVLADCDKLLPQAPSEKVWLPYLGDALDAGAATLFAFEIIEACKTIIGPHPVDGIWLGAANDVIMRERGIEFVDGTAPGFAAIVGAAPDSSTAVKIARELQEKNLYVFMAGQSNGTSFAEQLHKEGVQLGWETRLVPFGRDVSAAIYALGFANRAALAFGGVHPGDFKKNLKYNKNRIFAFVLALGPADREKYAAAAGAINYGFPTIADTDIPQILPTGVCTYEHVVSSVPHDKIVERALEVRGCKIKITKIPIPVPYGAAFEGERIRKNDVQVEFGGGRSTAFEFVASVPLDAIEDGVIEVIGSEIDQVPIGTALPLAIWVEVAGRKMQSDFEPVLERQIHHLLNGAEGLWHMGQRDIVWTRVSQTGFAKGLRLKHYGEIIRAKFLSNYPAIVDKVKVTLITDQAEVERRISHARKIYIERNQRLAQMTDEAVETFYSCLLCQSFAPNHVCIITPERLGLCGAYNWLDGKAAYEIDETGPNRPVAKKHCLDPVRGIWEGVNEYVYVNSHKTLSSFTAYSLMDRPMTSCGCFECILAYVPECNGVMAVNREFIGDTPVGMPFSTLAGTVGGGASTPGFMGVGKAFLASRKLLYADGGLKRIVWMPKQLKAVVAEDFKRRAEEEGIQNFLDMIADEDIATAPADVLAHLKKVKHPALAMPDMTTLWATDTATTVPQASRLPLAHEPPQNGMGGSRTAPTNSGLLPDMGGSRTAPTNEDKATPQPPAQPKAPSPAPSETMAATTPTSASVSVALPADMNALLAKLKAELKAELTREVAGEIIGTLQDKFLGGRVVPSSTVMKSSVSDARSADEAAAHLASSTAEVKPASLIAEAKPATPATEKPARYASDKLAVIKTFALPKQPSGDAIQKVTLGSGQRKPLVVGGQNVMPFHYFEGVVPHSPVLALEVFDTVSEKFSPVLKQFWGELLLQPVEMAKKCVKEYGAQLISVRLEGTHPEKGAKSPDAALALVQDVLAAVDVPVIVTAHNHFESANAVLKKVAAGCDGQRLLLNWCEGDNYRIIAGSALAYGHCVVARSPIDVNLAKQLNILLGNMDLPRDRIVMDPLTGALGYGLEYTFSVIERIRLTALSGDSALAFPILVHVGQEVWKIKEANAPQSAFPAWGDVQKRSVLFEIQTAMPLIMAGADIVILYHPESLATIQRNVAKLARYTK
ncbi:MAG: acetyl-CoA decarbonylase/synthase complex subunit alpha/beta [Planctomycetota bacterium]